MSAARRNPRRARSLLALLPLVCSLAACSGGSGSGSAAAGDAATVQGSAAPAASASPSGPATGPAGVLFDDFHYSGPKDPQLAAHGWQVRTGEGGPGIQDTWTAAGLSFPADQTAQGGKLMQVRAGTDGTKQGTQQTEIQSSNTALFNGTFAARVYFGDKPSGGRAGDHDVQAFFPISPSETSPNYSELDYEYTPAGGWGTAGPDLYTTSWTKADPPDRVTHALHQHMDGWHLLMITAVDGKATYSMDGKELFTSTGKYAARELMDIHFSNWFIDTPGTGATRTWDLKVNWFYYKAGAAVSQADVQKAVDGFYAGGTDFLNTVPKS